tara:strand:- start:1015 stop:1332 length:318 start_codon:yes stop_codon:yes gene_type:complete
MAHWSLVTYTRPNTGVSWYTPGSDVMTVVNAQLNSDPKLIESYEVTESGDGLKQYYKIAFKDESTSEALAENATYLANVTERNNYCTANNITCNVQQFGATEPTI